MTGPSKQAICVCNHVIKALSLVLKYKWPYVFRLMEGAISASYDTHLCDGIPKQASNCAVLLFHSDLETFSFITMFMSTGSHRTVPAWTWMWSFPGMYSSYCKFSLWPKSAANCVKGTT